MGKFMQARNALVLSLAGRLPRFKHLTCNSCRPIPRLSLDVPCLGGATTPGRAEHSIDTGVARRVIATRQKGAPAAIPWSIWN